MPLWAVDSVHSRDGILTIRGLIPPYSILPNRPEEATVSLTRRSTLEDWCLLTENAAFLKRKIQRRLDVLRLAASSAGSVAGSEQAIGFTLDLQLNRGCPKDPETSTPLTPAPRLPWPRRWGLCIVHLTGICALACMIFRLAWAQLRRRPP